KQMGLVHARQSSDQHIEKHQNQIGRMILDPFGRTFENALQPAAQAKLVTKTLDQEQTAEMSQRLRFETKVQCLQAFSHWFGRKKTRFSGAPITVRNGRFLARAKTARFGCTDKPVEHTSARWGAFLRLKGWAIVGCPSGTRTTSKRFACLRVKS